MKDKKIQGGRGTGVGMASVLMIVMVLALTCFSLLALVSARADVAASRRAESFTAAYYSAEGRLQGRLAELDGRLALQGAVLGESVTLTENVREGQELVMELAPPAEGSQARYVVVSCTLKNTGDWGQDEELTLWNGGD